MSVTTMAGEVLEPEKGGKGRGGRGFLSCTQAEEKKEESLHFSRCVDRRRQREKESGEEEEEEKEEEEEEEQEEEERTQLGRVETRIAQKSSVGALLQGVQTTDHSSLPVKRTI